MKIISVLSLLAITILANANPGDILWKFDAENQITSAPTIDANGSLYFGSENQHIWAIDAKGNKKWSYPLTNNMVFSPVISSDGTIYADANDPNSFDTRVYAFSPTGALLWSTVITQDPKNPTPAGLDVGLGPLNIDTQGNLYAVATYWPKGA